MTFTVHSPMIKVDREVTGGCFKVLEGVAASGSKANLSGTKKSHQFGEPVINYAVRCLNTGREAGGLKCPHVDLAKVAGAVRIPFT